MIRQGCNENVIFNYTSCIMLQGCGIGLYHISITRKEQFRYSVTIMMSVLPLLIKVCFIVFNVCK